VFGPADARRAGARPCPRRRCPPTPGALARAVGEARQHRRRPRRHAHPRQVHARPPPRRAGDLTDAPDAVVRPGSHDEVAAVLALASSTTRRGAVRRRHVRHRRLAARRDGYAGVVSLDLGRLTELSRSTRSR
jgi:alkyldihydroxyacetonephosphate synthase